MPEWLQNPHADYVVAAYAVALLALTGLGLASWRTAKRVQKAWQKIQK